MTYTPEQLKAAFFRLLSDFQKKTYYCSDICPFRKNYDVWLCCPGKSWGRPAEPDDCREAILKWYIRKV